MPHKRFFITFFIIHFSFYCFSQESSFVDENMKYIDSSTFKRKCKSYIYKCLEYKTDAFSIKKILYKFTFGKISTVEYDQIRKLLIKDSNTKIEPNSILVIKYYDSLFSYKTSNIKYIRHIEMHESPIPDSSGGKNNNKRIIKSISHKPYTKEKYNKNKMGENKTKVYC